MADPDWSRRVILADYIAVLDRGFTSPSWSTPGNPPELSPDEGAWIELLQREAAQDGIRVVAAWEGRHDGFHIACSIAHPRHDRSYGRLPKRTGEAAWRARYQLDWGMRLRDGKMRAAAEQAAAG